MRLKGLQSMITVVKHGNLEIFCGDNNGKITVWWIETAEILQQSKAHEGKVIDLQFDATKIVSCGIDSFIKVIDVMTGSILITLRGHNEPIVAVAFDNKQIISASRDGTLRTWNWGTFQTKKNQFHVFCEDDTMDKICRKYKIKESEFMKWNGIKDINSIQNGQQLRVQRNSPKFPQNNEKIKLKEIRRAHGTNLIFRKNTKKKKRMNALCVKKAQSMPGSLANRITKSSTKNMISVTTTKSCLSNM